MKEASSKIERFISFIPGWLPAAGVWDVLTDRTELLYVCYISLINLMVLFYYKGVGLVK